jgi:hypothetical protein
MPLRVHCVRLLLRLQSELGVYVPTLAYAVEVIYLLIDRKNMKQIKNIAPTKRDN